MTATKTTAAKNDHEIDLIPLFIVSGFLGSGKTTLINQLLKAATFANSAVIINEFGAVGIDHHFVEYGGYDVFVLADGCICCQSKGDLLEMLRKLVLGRNRGELPWFDRIILETSGLALPDQVTALVTSDPVLAATLVCACVIVCADVSNIERSEPRFDTVRRQLASAQLIVLTKTDLALAGQQANAETLCHLYNADAQIVVQTGEYDPDFKLIVERLDRFNFTSAAATQATPAFTAAAHMIDPDVSSFVIERDEPLNSAAVSEWVTALTVLAGDRILRAKGLVQFANEQRPVTLNIVQSFVHPTRCLVGWPDDCRHTRVVFIVTDLDAAQVNAALDLAVRIQSAGGREARFLMTVTAPRLITFRMRTSAVARNADRNPTQLIRRRESGGRELCDPPCKGDGVRMTSWESAVDEVHVTSRLLEGNAFGDPTGRTAFILRPPELEPDTPVILCLAGFGSAGRDLAYSGGFGPPLVARLYGAMLSGAMPSVVLVFPDGTTRYGASQYIDSPGAGPHQRHLLEEIVPAIQKRYFDDHRPVMGVVGRSSGGFGALRLALDKPDALSAVVAISPDCGFEHCYLPLFPSALDTFRSHHGYERFRDQPQDIFPQDAAFMEAMSLIAMASIYSPRLAEPVVFDFPCDPNSGAFDVAVWSRWVRHDPVRLVKEKPEGLRRLALLWIDVGGRDEYFMHWSARWLRSVLISVGVLHRYTEHEGGHRGTHDRMMLAIQQCGYALSSPAESLRAPVARN
jgi:G3E family GTPase/pimeloyl-ACP methyl ester carboxylesterase